MIGDLGFSVTDEMRSGLGEAAARRMLDGVAACVLGQITRPYPCAEQQTLTCAEDLQLPRERFCAFYGSFDWHSCVHSHWSLVRLVATGSLSEEVGERAVAQLDATLSEGPLARETAAWVHDVPDHIERPYGHTWLLELDAELGRLAFSASPLAGRARGWREALAPLVTEMRRRVAAWASGLKLPVRSGIHSDSAWSLAMAWDWARGTEAAEAGASAGPRDAELVGIVSEAARSLFGADVCAPVAYEPQGDTFTSSILNEAALMARALGSSEYEAWLRGFLPQLFEGDAAGAGCGMAAGAAATADGRGAMAGAAATAGTGAAAAPSPDFRLLPDPLAKWDGESYYGVHQVALPLSRAIAARDAAAPLPEGPARARLASESARWAREGLDDMTLTGYLADHWVGSFVVATLVGGDA